MINAIFVTEPMLYSVCWILSQGCQLHVTDGLHRILDEPVDPVHSDRLTEITGTNHKGFKELHASRSISSSNKQPVNSYWLHTSTLLCTCMYMCIYSHVRAHARVPGSSTTRLGWHVTDDVIAVQVVETQVQLCVNVRIQNNSLTVRRWGRMNKSRWRHPQPSFEWALV